MREPSEWGELDLGNGVRLLLGWRSGRRDLEARPADITNAMGREMRTACAETLARLSGMERRPFSGVPALEEGQYLSLPILEASDTSDASDGDDEADDEAGVLLPEEAVATAQLVELVRNAFKDDDFLSRSELEDGGWLYYAVVVEEEDEAIPIAFVRKYNPQRGISPGRFSASARGNVLTRFDDPFFNFDFDFDLVIAHDEIAILKVGAFNSVFSDLQLAKQQVPEHSERFADELGVKLRPASADVLQAACTAKPSLANRLRRLAHAGYLSKITKNSLSDALQKHGWRRDRLGKGTKINLDDVDDVTLFLELAEGLFYEADFSEERRRADRFSVRA